MKVVWTRFGTRTDKVAIVQLQGVDVVASGGKGVSGGNRESRSDDSRCKNITFIEVHTDEGLTGLGETFRTPRPVAGQIHETVAPYLLGKDPLTIDRTAAACCSPYLGFASTSAETRSNEDRNGKRTFVRLGKRPRGFDLSDRVHARVTPVRPKVERLYDRSQDTGHSRPHLAKSLHAVTALDGQAIRVEEIKEFAARRGVTAWSAHYRHALLAQADRRGGDVFAASREEAQMMQHVARRRGDPEGVV